MRHNRTTWDIDISVILKKKIYFLASHVVWHNINGNWKTIAKGWGPNRQSQRPERLRAGWGSWGKVNQPPPTM